MEATAVLFLVYVAGIITGAIALAIGEWLCTARRGNGK
jgi:hypothetical protein